MYSPAMYVLGLKVGARSTKRVLFGVVLDCDTRGVTLIEHVVTSGTSVASQSRALHDALISELTPHQISFGVLAEAGYFSKAAIGEATKQRFRLEGAALAACEVSIADVEVRDMRAIGLALGTDKDHALVAAAGLGLPDEYLEAGAAALAAEVLS